MGFWDSLLNTVEDAGHWVANNAGDIATAVNTVSKVVGAVGAAKPEDSLSGTNFLPNLCDNLETASSNLMNATEQYVPKPTVASEDPDTAPQLIGPLDLSCLIPDTAIVSTGQAPAATNADINKFLARNDLPTTMGTGANAVDVGMSIGEQMSTTPNPLPPAVTGPSVSSFVAAPLITVGPDPETGLEYTGGHVYYPIPLQGPNNTGTVAWHSQLRLYAKTTTQSRAAWEARKKSLAIKGRKIAHDAGTSFNATTVSAKWNSTLGTDQIMSNAITTMQGFTNPTFTYTSSTSSDGQKYIYQFNTTPDVGPTTVLQAFQTAIGANLPAGSGSGGVTTMPVTKVESQSTVIG